MVDASKVYTDEGVIKLAEAVRKGKSKQIKALIAEGVDPNAQGEKGYNLLMWAMVNRSKKGLVALLEAGADPAVGDDEGDTILHWAASVNDPSYLTLLLEHGVDPNLRNGKTGASALRDAIMGDREEQLRALLAAGADPNARAKPFKDGRPGDPVLHDAASTITEFVMILLEAGADPTARDGRGNTFQRAFFKMSEDIMTAEGKAEREQIRAWLRERNIPVEDGR